MVDAMMNSMSRFQADTAAGADAAARSRSSKSDEALREVAREFEALFVKQMLSSMRQTLDPGSDMLYGGISQDIFEDMLYEEYAKVMAKTGSLGIAELVYGQLK